MTEFIKTSILYQEKDQFSVEEIIRILEKMLQMLNNIAKKSESNFAKINGLVIEIIQTCTIAKSRTQTNQRVKKGRNEMYGNEGKLLKEKIDSSKGDRKQLNDDVIRTLKELEQTVLNLPGRLNVLSTTAVTRVLKTVKGAAELIQNFTKNLVTLNFRGLFSTVNDAAVDVVDAIEDFLTEDDIDDDSDEPISFEDKRTKLDEEIEKEMKIYSRISSIEKIIELLISLARKETIDFSEARDELWKTKDGLTFTYSALSKTTEVTKYAQLDDLVSCVLEVCQMVSQDTRLGQLSEETKNKSLKKLDEVQKSLDGIAKSKNMKLISKLQKAVESIKQKHILSGYRWRYFRSNDRIENIQEELRTIQQKTGGTYKKIQQIISSLLKACATLLNDYNSLDETRHEIVTDLVGTQQSLATILNDMDSSIKSKSEQLKKLQTSTSNQSQYKEYDVSKKRDIERMAKGQELYFYWKRYDRQVENIIEHYELLRETEETMSQLAFDLIELRKTLDLMSKAFTDLINVRSAFINTC